MYYKYIIRTLKKKKKQTEVAAQIAVLHILALMHENNAQSTMQLQKQSASNENKTHNGRLAMSVECKTQGEVR